jgi:carboxylate-amine ligase
VKSNFTGPCFTVGVEEEFMLLDPETLELAHRFSETFIGPDEHGEFDIKSELMESMLEGSTGPCGNLRCTDKALRELRAYIRDYAERVGLLIGSAGTHPFSQPADQRIVDKPHYKRLVEAFGLFAHQHTLFGLHVHVGIDDPEKAIYVVNGVRRYVPVLIALSANSPFWKGENTGFMSTRAPVWRSFPRVGVPPFYRNWEDYQQRVEGLIAAGVTDSAAHLWYDVRPNTELGTVEIRSLDAQTAVEETLALAALVQTLVKEHCDRFLADEEIPHYPREIINEDVWKAARYGLDAPLLHLPDNERISAKEMALELFERLGPRADELNCSVEFEYLLRIIEDGNGAMRQLKVFNETGDLKEVVKAVIRESAMGRV